MLHIVIYIYIYTHTHTYGLMMATLWHKHVTAIYNSYSKIVHRWTIFLPL